VKNRISTEEDSLTVDEADRKRQRAYRAALGLALFTIVFNVIEGLVSTYFGYEDESLALFGFGVDSFIEVISGLGIAHMVSRIQRDPDGNRDAFERTALRVTGVAFYGLVAGLSAMSIYNIATGHKPATTLWGVIVSAISITIMWALVRAKRKVGRELGSQAILADAECTRVCIYMSIVLLVASAIYELTGIGYVDAVGTFGLAYFSFKEGRECFEKAAGRVCCSCSGD
jgi:divalent metal cation (Fe/Co/Zn/Cd) transporter